MQVPYYREVIFWDENKILFTYDCASDNLTLNGASNRIVPVFDPVETSVQVRLSDRKTYRMRFASAEPKRLLNVLLTAIDD